jgi:DNA-binding CsgD family transcriptional regulator
VSVLPSLLERDGEQQQIEQALAGAVLGEGKLIVFYGTAGVGRSSLLERAAQLASAREFRVLRARGSRWESGYAFGVARQLLEPFVAGPQGAQPPSLFDGAAAAALPAVGLAPRQHAGPVPGSGFDQIHGLHLAVSRLAADRPLLIAVDDVHWCDRPSLDFLCFLGERARQLPVVVALSWRRGEPEVRAGRLQALAGERDTVFLAPQPLSARAVRELMARELGQDPDDDAVNLVRARTGGVPFLVDELVAALRRRRAGPGTPGAITAETPERVRRDVAARLGRHQESVRRLACAVAVLGDGCSLAQAAQLAKVNPEKAPQLADALVRADFLRLDRTLSFLHPLVRDATYGTLSSVEQASLHGAAALLLIDAAGDVDAAQVAGHLLRSEPAGDPRFERVLRDAALSALREGALPRAHQCLRRALDEAGHAADGETLALMGELDLRLGDLAAAERHLRKALPLAGSQTRRLSTATACAEAIAAAHGCAPAARLLEGELNQCGRPDSALGLGLRAAIASLRLCHHAAQDDLAAGPLDRAGDGTAAQRTLLAVAASLAVLQGTARADEVIGACRGVLADVRWEEQDDREVAASYFACRAALLAEDLELVEQALPAHPEQLARETTADPGLAALAARCQLRLCRGDLRHAEADAATVACLIEARPPTALRRRMRDDVVVVRILADLYAGSARAARQLLPAVTGDGAQQHPAVPALMIMLALLEGHADEAVTSGLPAGIRELPTGIAAPGVSWRPVLALACHRGGAHREAVTLAAEHLAAARAWGAPAHLARALLTQAAISSGPARLELIQEAVGLLEGGQADLELAQARIELGAALRRHRRCREAREELSTGADLAHRCGAGELAGRAHAELVVAGARPRRMAFTGLESLTPGERRVAELAATEMTTRQIALSLTVSMKTVAGQLSAVYRKLDVHDRQALAAALTGAGEPTS